MGSGSDCGGWIYGPTTYSFISITNDKVSVSADAIPGSYIILAYYFDKKEVLEPGLQAATPAQLAPYVSTITITPLALPQPIAPIVCD